MRVQAELFTALHELPNRSGVVAAFIAVLCREEEQESVSGSRAAGRACYGLFETL